MVKGKPVSREIRNIIHDNVMAGVNNGDIWRHLFPNGTDIMTYELLCRYASICKSGNRGAILTFLSGANKIKSGRPRIVDNTAEQIFVLPYKGHGKQLRLNKYVRKFRNEYYGNQLNAPSISTLKRIIARNNITRKKFELRHFKQCPIERINFLYRISCYEPHMIIDIDETPFNKAEINEDRGYAPKGKRAYKTQIVINGKTYSILAAACSRGFLCWAIYDIPITSEIFVDFLDKYLVPLLLEGSVGLIDNAAIHKTKESWKKMDEIFHGNWLYSSPYSPDLKPIEKCFSLIKSKLRELELEAIIRPIRTINRVIEMYSINGPEGHKCQGFWNCIKHYHQKRLLMYGM